MNFRTQIPILKSNCPIDYDSKMVSLGSCFVENMGDKFDYYKFQNEVNPFGIIFNPVSIERLLSRVVINDFYNEQNVFFHNDLWHCYEVHSELSNTNKDELINILNHRIRNLRNILENATHVIITFGTSWVYRELFSKEIVANCHKVPQKKFSKELLTVSEIEDSITSTVNLIRKVNTDCQVLFTVSPVRHIKDGFVENQRSKAHLVTSVHNILENKFKGSKMSYFPSYEIMMDELRDYRFYSEDMIHPSKTAIDYIWRQFVASHINSNCISIMDEVDSIQKSIRHRPFNPETEAHKKFLKNLDLKIKKLETKVPAIKF